MFLFSAVRLLSYAIVRWRHANTVASGREITAHVSHISFSSRCFVRGTKTTQGIRSCWWFVRLFSQTWLLGVGDLFGGRNVLRGTQTRRNEFGTNGMGMVQAHQRKIHSWPTCISAVGSIHYHPKISAEIMQDTHVWSRCYKRKPLLTWLLLEVIKVNVTEWLSSKMHGTPMQNDTW